MQILETKIPAPIVAILIGVLMKWYAHATNIMIDPTSLRMMVGVGLSQISAVLALAVVVHFWRRRTTINPINPDKASHLVTYGVFRFSRNPMYLSLLLLLVAYAIRLDSLAVWIAPVVFVAYVTRFQIMPEERVLTKKFGEAYLTYKHRTRRWI